mgnify:CR=1 FL=1
MNLYESTNEYEVLFLKDRDEWLKARETRIGGSEASSLIGMNKYTSLHDLWERKIKGIQSDVSNELIEYGNTMEPLLRELYRIKHPEMDVQYSGNTILYSKQYEWVSYSPDGLLWDGSRAGILEIKTSFIRNTEMGNEWKDKIPDSYYLQILHGLICTGFEFVNLIAELRYIDGNSSIRQYHIERLEVLDDIEYLLRKERENWEKYFLSNLEPPIIVKI